MHCNQFAQQIDCLPAHIMRSTIFICALPLSCNQFAQQIDCLPAHIVRSTILICALPLSCNQFAAQIDCLLAQYSYAQYSSSTFFSAAALLAWTLATGILLRFAS